MRYVPAIAITAALALTATAAVAAKKHHPRYAPHPQAAYVAPGTGSSFAPARIIEARPGVFISSYDCLLDDGYGRVRRCSDGKK